MADIIIRISDEELKSMVEAYQTLQNFLEKIAPPNELYLTDFLEGLQEARAEMKNGQTSEIENFANFIQ